MRLKINIDTNIDDHLNDAKACQEAIDALKDILSTIREEMYGHYLSPSTLLPPAILSLVFLLIYLVSKNQLFLHMMPLPVIVTMVMNIIIAERVTGLIKKELNHKIAVIKKKKMYFEAGQ